MSDHDDKFGLGYLFEQLHYLHAGRAVQSARGLVGEYYLGIVYESAGYRNSLHLSARQLIGQFFDLFGKPHLCERFARTAVALRPSDAGKRERHRHVVQYRHMGYQIIALEYETDTQIAISVPVHVFVDLRGYSVYDKISARIAVQTSDYVEQRGLAAAGLSEYGNEFGIPEFEIDPLQSADFSFAYGVIFGYRVEFEHIPTPLSFCIFIL